MSSSLKRSLLLRGVAVAIVLSALAILVPFSEAHAPVMGITIVNNSAKEIRHVYLSAPDNDNWGPNQLGSSTIPPGGSHTLSNISCSGAGIKVIAENIDGCFHYRVVACSESATVTIASDAVPDCGD